MATLSNPVFYAAGASGASAVVGFETQRNRVVRYDLSLEQGESASSISVLFDEGDGSIVYGNGQLDRVNEDMTFYFAVSTDPDAFADAGYADISRASGQAVFTLYRGSVENGDAHYRVLCEADVLIHPDTQYYLWVFPGFSNIDEGNNTWGWVGWSRSLEITVTLSGAAGLVYVGGLSGIPFVWHNNAWRQGFPEVVKSVMYLYGTPSESGNIGLRSGDTVTYYDGAVLPALPERDKEKYPYAYILYTFFPKYCLYLTNRPLYATWSEGNNKVSGVHSNGEFEWMGGGVKANGKEWATGVHTESLSTGFPPIWSNTDMFKAIYISEAKSYELTDEIGFKATEPIPVGEIVDYDGDIPIYEVIT